MVATGQLDYPMMGLRSPRTDQNASIVVSGYECRQCTLFYATSIITLNEAIDCMHQNQLVGAVGEEW